VFFHLNLWRGKLGIRVSWVGCGDEGTFVEVHKGVHHLVFYIKDVLLRISHLAFCKEEVNQRDKGYHLVVKVVILVSLKHEDRICEGNSLNFEVCIF
jgi:hypothetical protein